MIMVIRHLHHGMRVCVRSEDGICSEYFGVEQGLRQDCVLSASLQHVLLFAVLAVILQRLSTDGEVLVILVRVEEPRNTMGPETAMDRTQWQYEA